MTFTTVHFFSAKWCYGIAQESVTRRRGGRCNARVPEARGPLETPGPPGLRAAPVGHRRHAGLWVECGGGLADALCAAGDEPPGAKPGPAPGRAWPRGPAG